MATVIRRGSNTEAPAGESVRPPSYTLSNLQTHGDEYVDTIRAEAAKLIQQANGQAEQIRLNAEKAGAEAARKSIESLLDERIGQRLKTLDPALGEIKARLDAAHDAWLDHWEKSAIRLAAAMAERIVRRELASDPEISIEWIRESLELASGSTEITVRLSPADIDHLSDKVAELASSIGRLGETTIVPDESISAGGCRIETKHGSVDQQLETQLQRLTEELT